MNLPHEDEAPGRGEKGAGESWPPRNLGDLHKTITMAQIARAAGVSQGAISSLLNDRDYGIRVSEKTRERVFKVCREMGYIPNDLRAVVRMYPEVGDFCLMISTSLAGGFSHPFVARIAQAAMEAIPDPSHPLTLAFYDRNEDYSNLPSDQLPYPVRSGVASKFLFVGEPNPSLLQHLSRRGLPVVSLGSDAGAFGVLSLVPDYAAVSRMAIEHLFKLGHKQIAIVSGPFGTNDPQIIDMHRGVKQAYDQLGISIEAHNIVYGDLSARAGVAALNELLSHPVQPTAIFCLGDPAAAGVMAQAHIRKIRVPEDLSVIGSWDDLCSHVTVPPLTSIHVPAEEMAAVGVKELDRLIRAGAQIDAQKRILPVTLVERGSAAPPKP